MKRGVVFFLMVLFCGLAACGGGGAETGATPFRSIRSMDKRIVRSQ
ncbi:MAG: hypothetical protein MPW17_06965 [Candidatus Manganitrophus sp.]|nr:MAG: hypothetical protein MPW17_06965 [Candidatus Manganitrophus sp.]